MTSQAPSHLGHLACPKIKCEDSVLRPCESREPGQQSGWIIFCFNESTVCLGAQNSWQLWRGAPGSIIQGFRKRHLPPAGAFLPSLQASSCPWKCWLCCYSSQVASSSPLRCNLKTKGRETGDFQAGDSVPTH